MSAAVNKDVGVINGLGSARAVIGWIGFATVVVLEIVQLIDASEPLWAEIQAFATVEILWIAMLALAGFGDGLRLFAAYTQARSGTSGS